MADKTRRQSDMKEDPVLDVVKRSQCADCIHNKGLQCSVHGIKPAEYVNALSDKKCPDRKKDN